jgi:hypothetical protein
MNCPNCQVDSNKVTDKRNWEGSGLSGTKRRRECLGCGHRWTTLELSVTFQGRAVILPGMSTNGNGHKPAPTPKPQVALTAKEKDLKKRLAMALHRARCKSVVIEDEDLE